MIRFTVSGKPATKGSARAFVVRGGANGPRAVITNDAGEKAKSWAAMVSDAARAAAGDAKPIDGGVRVRCVFHLRRPQSHFKSNGALKPGAPTHAATKPDGDKLERCTWDALTGILFTDDARIVEWSGAKPYSDDGRTGATIEVEAITSVVPARVTRAPSPQVQLPIEEEV